MKISRVVSGALVVVLSKEERAALPGPYDFGLSQDGGQVTIYHSERGNEGSKDLTTPGCWRIAFKGTASIASLAPFGQVTVKSLIGEGKIVAHLPDTLPDARKINRKAKKLPPAVVNNLIQTVGEPISGKLPELVRQLNTIREESPDSLVFSTDADGYLRVTVEYGRG